MGPRRPHPLADLVQEAPNQVAYINQARLDAWAATQHRRLTAALQHIADRNYGLAEEQVRSALDEGPTLVEDYGYVDWRYWPAR